MAEPMNNPAAQEPTPGAGGEVTFTQAEVDALISKEKAKAVAKATKGIPGEEELAAFRAWKESRQTEQDRLRALTQERDAAQSQLTAAQAELEQFKREKFLLERGVPAGDVDYYAFKIGKLASDAVTFEQAAEQFFKEKGTGTVRVDFSAPVGGGKPQQTPNETMNSLLRGLKK